MRLAALFKKLQNEAASLKSKLLPAPKQSFSEAQGMFCVSPSTYTKTGCGFGRVPIVLHLGDFLQLRPTAQLSLLDDLDAKDEDNNYVHQDVPAEVQHAQRLFASIPDVFELRGTMRFKPGDPLIDILRHMQFGEQFPDDLWQQLQARFAVDAAPGVQDPRFEETKFPRPSFLGDHSITKTEAIP
eukprot:s5712_g1.t1